jgi:serine/threonine protein kinase
MEYISGIPLSSYLKGQPGSCIIERDAKKIFQPLVDSVRYLHSINVSHRDIKLENVLLDGRLLPKLIDFGFATCIFDKAKIFCGTPSYMSPEIVLKTEYRGEPADVWALGVLLYVMLTGIFPFKGQTDKELYKKIVASDYPKL